ncbi:MAG: 16S rRNA (uracil(1498)-N(3))-methyltransferase [candidate division KSB1 bacterium]|nr:16S rRNA (uracil(1498)-N(3))-methyltransferase [candidate division KSB1 bacterium]MDZ7275690.1 16S rRNA (uracil(1498)-N(3))-methyltransferase [candidate division KSB1 bacterium]MDZ7284619.1 16S rRNA (uracil(1498)-N(3))-methyltransferase [candidate division KSB1 bacterium]MDZ7297962.1 16S rRNA (uracil(1498)-N(3))-methyltransferase [candidate division KSB1 bacterium]MDZ7305870.1 16S rRNA (uracil(1498)-N(3))-methyltransferase [candidate division KSB1 bacterium]
MSRQEFFYAPAEHFAGEFVTLTGDEHHHLSRVLHHKAGDRVTVVDGAGNAAVDGEIVFSDRAATRIKIHTRAQNLGEPAVHLTLAQAVPKGARFDWLVEKGTEIGVSAFIPLLSHYSEVNPGPGKSGRWRRLALAAMKQSCRSVWPAVSEPVRFIALMQACHDFDLALLAHPTAIDISAKLGGQALPRRVLLLVGPEGGFSEEEVTLAQQAGCKLLSLGPRRLRAETAGLVAAAKVLAAYGQL